MEPFVFASFNVYFIKNYKFYTLLCTYGILNSKVNNLTFISINRLKNKIFIKYKFFENEIFIKYKYFVYHISQVHFIWKDSIVYWKEKKIFYCDI